VALRDRGLEENDEVRIVRELADEGNSIAKIAFMTRLPESVIRKALWTDPLKLDEGAVEIRRPCGC
jgi:hypothetical protein